jgi:hypothetical protein
VGSCGDVAKIAGPPSLNLYGFDVVGGAEVARAQLDLDILVEGPSVGLEEADDSDC